jgi:spermidine synthase
MGLWFTERQTKNLAISCRVKKTIYSEETPFQELAVIDTLEFGRMLVLDNVIQTTVKDEFVYHEMIAHVALNTHPGPRRVLVVGGGDGGTVREIVKHPSVERVVLCEIDEKVVAAAKDYLPEISHALEHPKVEIAVTDGIKHVKEKRGTYDVIIIDSTDPVGPAEGLFSAAFYQDVAMALREDGLFVAQTESPFFNKELIKRIFKDVSGIFPVVRLFLANVPTYPGGLWTFTMGSKKYDPLTVEQANIKDYGTKYYSPEVHHAAFILPPFIAELLK